MYPFVREAGEETRKNGGKTPRGRWGSRLSRRSSALAVVSGLSCATCGVDSKENSSEQAVRGQSWTKLPRPPSPLQNAPFFPSGDFIVPWELIAQGEYFSKYVFRTFCKIASSWIFDKEWLFLWGICVSSCLWRILTIFAQAQLWLKGANGHRGQQPFTTWTTESAYFLVVAAGWPLHYPFIIIEHIIAIQLKCNYSQRIIPQLL